VKLRKSFGYPSKHEIDILKEFLIGGTVWESNPPDHARWSQAVLKTVENTSLSSSPILESEWIGHNYITIEHPLVQ
jgi:hypothetical protein